MKREFVLASIAALLLTAGAATITVANASDEAQRTDGAFETATIANEIGCEAQTWPQIDPACLRDINGGPTDRDFRIVTF